jgi:hypothetical protein
LDWHGKLKQPSANETLACVCHVRASKLQGLAWLLGEAVFDQVRKWLFCSRI